MTCEDAWKRFRELGVECAKMHRDFAELVESPQLMKTSGLTPEEGSAIDDAVERCQQCDEKFQAARLTAIAEQH